MSLIATGIILVLEVPTLVSTSTDVLAFVGTFFTIYGVIFAIVEVIRLQAVAQIASSEARQVYTQLTRIKNSEIAGKCQAYINNAIRNADNFTDIPDTLLSDIHSMYRELIVHDESTGDVHKMLEDILVAHMGKVKQDPYKKPTKVIQALTAMSANLSVVKNNYNKLSEA